MAINKLYDLTDAEIKHLLALGFRAQGIGYVKPNGYMASKADITTALQRPAPASITTQKYIYSNILQRAVDQKIFPNKSQESRTWFRNKASNLRGARIDTGKLFENSVTSSTPLPGRMFMFSYDAKNKDTLPYWDSFPLIFMVGPATKGFYGINLHYLPPVLRAKMMDALYTIANNQRFDDTTKINLSYQTLKNASKFSLFKPCFKHYLYSQVESKFIYVEPKEWDIALMLPVQKFQKATAQQVWKDSQRGV